MEASTVLATAITAESISGVLNEVTGLIPVVIPAAISFLAIRKGLSFVFGVLRAA